MLVIKRVQSAASSNITFFPYEIHTFRFASKNRKLSFNGGLASIDPQLISVLFGGFFALCLCSAYSNIVASVINTVLAVNLALV